MENKYIADFTNDRLLLGIFKMTSHNNAMLRTVLENILEIRTSLSLLEASSDEDLGDEFLIKMAEIKQNTVQALRPMIEEAVQAFEQKSMKEAFEFAWMNDPDSSLDASDL